MTDLAPILEFDADQRAILNPFGPREGQRIPERAVLCFFAEVINDLLQNGLLEQIGELRSEIGPSPLYRLRYDGPEMMIFHPGVGAPLAAGFLEEVIGLGARKFIACGGCGVLRQDIVAGHPVVLASAVRDEGTSYHYLPPSREAQAHPAAVAALEAVMRARQIPYLLGKSWTTDALYRETPARRQRRVDEGCEVVEMEAAAFFAVAQFRGAVFGQVVYGGDLVVPEGWDERGWFQRGSDRARLLQLAVEACGLL